MDENDMPISDSQQPDAQTTAQMSQADDTLTPTPVLSQPKAVPMDMPEYSNTSNVPTQSDDDKKEHARGEASAGTERLQRNTFLFLALIGFFLSAGFDLLKNAISLPSWMSSISLFLVVTFVALLMLLESIRAHAPVKSEERRAFLKHSLLSGSTIGLLAVLGSLLIIGETNLKKEREELEKEQKAFNAQKKGQLTQLRIASITVGDIGPSDVRPFENALSDLLGGIPVSLAYPGKTYADTIHALGKGDFEAAWLGPFSYLRAHQTYGVRVILRDLTLEHKKTYQSYIIADARTDIHRVEDLKGKRFALVDPNSTSGRLIPLYELKKAGLDLDKDIDTFYAGSHTNVLEKVLSGQVPAGAVASNVYQKYLREGKFHEGDLVRLVESSDIPTGPIVVRKEIQPYDELRVKDAFLTVAEIDPSIISTMQIGGFAQAAPKDYEPLLEIAKELHITLSQFNQ